VIEQHTETVDAIPIDCQRQGIMSRLEYVLDVPAGQYELTQIFCVVMLGGPKGGVPAVSIAVVYIRTRLEEAGTDRTALMRWELRCEVQRCVVVVVCCIDVYVRAGYQSFDALD
jgi:hypothetical protein